MDQNKIQSYGFQLSSSSTTLFSSFILELKEKPLEQQRMFYTSSEQGMLTKVKNWLGLCPSKVILCDYNGLQKRTRRNTEKLKKKKGGWSFVHIHEKVMKINTKVIHIVGSNL